MHSKERFPNVVFGASLRPEGATLAILLMFLFLMFALLFITLTVRTSQAQVAQNEVPPTARQAAASPAFVSKLHPSTPPAARKTRASAPACLRGASPQGGVLYENGPVNGTVDAWTINFGYIVSDSFEAGSVGGFDIWVWEFSGDKVSSVDWSITSAPNGGTVYGSGTAKGNNVSDQFISSNQFGFDIDEVSVSGVNVDLGNGTFWLNLQNATVPSGDPVFWDENSGVGCHSPGCPSQAVDSGVGTIPSEAFDIGGGRQCYESGGYMQIIHDFTGKEDGSSPSGVVADAAGNVYGTVGNMVYEIASKAQDWLFNILYSFTGGSDGSSASTPIVGADGALYGAATGGTNNLGLVYRLRPAPTPCVSVSCPWTKSVVYQPTGNKDATNPGNLVFDQAGNLYGTSGSGGAYGKGAVFELTPSHSGWTEAVLYSFTGGSDGSGPGSLVVSNDGNLYGTGGGGAYGEGMIFQLVRPPSGGNWTENVVYIFTGDPNKGDGKAPYSLVQGGPGSLAGLAVAACLYSRKGAVVFLLSPSHGSWVFSVISTSCIDVDVWSNTSLAADAADNVYWADGNTSLCGSDGWVSTWRLFPIGQGSDLWHIEEYAFLPSGQLGLDANHNVYGTTQACGKYGLGTIWRVTQ